MITHVTSSCLSSSSSSATTSTPTQQYLLQTKDTVESLRNSVLESAEVQQDLGVLETDQKRFPLQQKEKIACQAGVQSLQTLIVAKVVASDAYDEFKKRASSAIHASKTAYTQSAALLQRLATLQSLQSNNAEALLQAMLQFESQIQTLKNQIMQLPSATPNILDPQVRKEIETIFAAWIVQNCQEAVAKMRGVAQSVFASSISVYKCCLERFELNDKIL